MDEFGVRKLERNLVTAVRMSTPTAGKPYTMSYGARSAHSLFLWMKSSTGCRRRYSQASRTSAHMHGPCTRICGLLSQPFLLRCRIALARSVASEAARCRISAEDILNAAWTECRERCPACHRPQGPGLCIEVGKGMWQQCLQALSAIRLTTLASD